MKTVRLHDRLVGDGEACFIIAEAGVNHNGDVTIAQRLIEAAKATHADAIKFQTFKTERMITQGTPKARYQEETTGKGSQYEMVKKLELSDNEFRTISRYAKEKGIMFLSTPFDMESVDLLEELDVPGFKVGSGDLTNLPLLEYIARKDRPMLVSTGMATLAEVTEAVTTIKDAGNHQIILLHCTSNYPARIEDCNLRAMDTLRNEYDVPVGYSDHTLGITIPIAAVAMGACVIEKHFTLDNNQPGPDHRASLESDELKEMVTRIRMIEKALGSKEKKPTESENEIKKIARKSVVSGIDIPQGTTITREMLAFKRPGTGLEPKFVNEIIGKKSKKDIKCNELITFDKVS